MVCIHKHIQCFLFSFGSLGVPQKGRSRGGGGGGGLGSDGQDHVGHDGHDQPISIILKISF